MAAEQAQCGGERKKKKKNRQGNKTKTKAECTRSPSHSERSGILRNVSLTAGMIWWYMCNTSRQCMEKEESFRRSQCSNIRVSLNEWTLGPVHIWTWPTCFSWPLILSHCLCKTTTTVRTTWTEKCHNTHKEKRLEPVLVQPWMKVSTVQSTKPAASYPLYLTTHVTSHMYETCFFLPAIQNIR